MLVFLALEEEKKSRRRSPAPFFSSPLKPPVFVQLRCWQCPLQVTFGSQHRRRSRCVPPVCHSGASGVKQVVSALLRRLFNLPARQRRRSRPAGPRTCRGCCGGHLFSPFITETSPRLFCLQKTTRRWWSRQDGFPRRGKKNKQECKLNSLVESHSSGKVTFK